MPLDQTGYRNTFPLTKVLDRLFLGGFKDAEDLRSGNASSMDPGSPTGGRGKPIKFFASPTCSPPMSSMRIGVYQPGFPVSQFYPYAMGQ